MRRIAWGAITVLVWVLAIMEIGFFIAVGVACQGC